MRGGAESCCTRSLPQVLQGLRLGLKAVGLWGRPNDVGLKYLCTSMQWDLIGIHSMKIPCLTFLSLVSHNTSSMFCPKSIERVVNLAHVLILQRHLFLACFFNADEETLAANIGDPTNHLLLSISD